VTQRNINLHEKAKTGNSNYTLILQHNMTKMLFNCSVVLENTQSN